MLSLYKVLMYNVEQGCFGILSRNFHKKSGYPAIKRKQDALIEMKALRKTPRNAAGKSYEAGMALEDHRKPRKSHAAMRSKAANG